MQADSARKKTENRFSHRSKKRLISSPGPLSIATSACNLFIVEDPIWEAFMGGGPMTQDVSEECESRLGEYTLNLSPEQIEELARELAIKAADRSSLKMRLAEKGHREPKEGQELMVTFKGRYRRIKFRKGRAELIPHKK